MMVYNLRRRGDADVTIKRRTITATCGGNRYFLANLLDVAWVSRWNVALGVPDRAMIFGVETLHKVQRDGEGVERGGTSPGQNFIMFRFKCSYLNEIRVFLHRNWFQCHLVRSGNLKKSTPVKKYESYLEIW